VKKDKRGGGGAGGGGEGGWGGLSRETDDGTATSSGSMGQCN